ncbi:hypothetical protein DFH08DRAFT_1075578 [Mycena albidolilacea]|uniref:Uncharacterized protein n=1 Tax=Mycena albidolilacea TaxID=1033008 RepID=A0AAD7F0W8_9AGAR|nr:hypothetical protein DFH08DRAFT_1075578 [Mycena albidolilacea]
MQELVDCDPNANPMVSLPHLRKLRLKNLEYLRLITAPNLESTSDALCPNLTFLGLGYFYLRDQPSWEPLLSIARSRFRPTSRGVSLLSSLRVFVGSHYLPLKPDVRAELQKLQDDGFDAAFLMDDEATLVSGENLFSWLHWIDGAVSPPSLTLFARLRGVTRVATARCNDDVDFDGGAHRGAFRLPLDWTGRLHGADKETKNESKYPFSLVLLDPDYKCIGPR